MVLHLHQIILLPFQKNLLEKTWWWQLMIKLETKNCNLMSLDYQNIIQLILANSANTKFHPFQIKIKCSNFIIDRLLQRCHVTVLIYLFVTSRNLLLGVFLPRKIISILRKIGVNFRQVPLKGVLLLVSILECFGKIF